MSSKSDNAKANVTKDELAEEIAQAAAEIEKYRRGMASSVRMTALAFIIVIAAIGGYLKLIVYDQIVVGFSNPENMVAAMKNVVEDTLTSNELPSLESGELPQWGIDKLKEMAPSLVNDTLKPQVQEQAAKLPEYRAQIVKDVQEKAPQTMEDALVKLETDVLPKGREYIINHIGEQVDLLLDEGDAQLSAVIAQIVTEQKENIQVMTDKDLLQQALAEAFEAQMGPFVDQIFTPVEPHIVGAAASMEKVVRAEYKTDTEKLDLRIMQLVSTIYTRYVGELSDEQLLESTPGTDLLDKVLQQETTEEPAAESI